MKSYPNGKMRMYNEGSDSRGFAWYCLYICISISPGMPFVSRMSE